MALFGLKQNHYSMRMKETNKTDSQSSLEENNHKRRDYTTDGETGAQKKTRSIEDYGDKKNKEFENINNNDKIKNVAKDTNCTSDSDGSDKKSTNNRRITPGYEHKKTYRRVYSAKKHHRSDIKPDEWNKYNYAERSKICENLFNENYYRSFSSNVYRVPRINRKDITVAEFIEKYEKTSTPVLIEGNIGHWPAFRNWQINNLERKYRKAHFKVGEDDDGHRIKMKLKSFVAYMSRQVDDSPLYLFDSTFDEYTKTCNLKKDYEVPDLFPYDLHMILGEEKRPPYKWFCIGPKRSGTTIHTDPIGTSAWNALVLGYKSWVLFPPDTPKRIVKAKHLIEKGEDDEAIMYFDFIIPRILQEYPEVIMLHGLQKPGDVIFVPSGWWHAVLNLEDTVACTQNFVSHANFEVAWRLMRSGRPRLAATWLSLLQRFHPCLYAVASHLNKRDNWIIENDRMKSFNSESDSSSSSSSSSNSSDDEDELAEIKSTIKREEAKLDSSIRKIKYSYDGDNFTMN